VTDFVVVLASAAESDIAQAFAWYRERSSTPPTQTRILAGTPAVTLPSVASQATP